MIIEVDDPNDFLEHFGIKGMRWGVRKNTQESTSNSEGKGKSHRNRNLAIAATVAVGAVATAVILKKHGNSKLYHDYSKDYPNPYPNRDLGPMGLKSKHFGPGYIPD